MSGIGTERVLKSYFNLTHFIIYCYQLCLNHSPDIVYRSSHWDDIRGKLPYELDSLVHWELSHLYFYQYRSSHWRCSVEVFLEISLDFQGKHLWQSLFFNKVAGLSCSFLRSELILCLIVKETSNKIEQKIYRLAPLKLLIKDHFQKQFLPNCQNFGGKKLWIIPRHFLGISWRFWMCEKPRHPDSMWKKSRHFCRIFNRTLKTQSNIISTP